MYHSDFVLTSFKKYSIFLALALGFASVTACSSADNKAAKVEKTTSATTATTSTIATTTNSAQTSTTAVTGSKPVIYASTNMWGAIAKAVGGDNVDVVTAIDSPNQDPHEYQASAKDKLAMQNANVVLVNGGGYDDWALSVADSLTSKPTIINAFDLSGFDNDKEGHKQEEHKDHAGHGEHDHHHGEVNEHVFYSLTTAQKVAQAIANQLATSDPAKKAIYLQNLQAFNDKITCLKGKATGVAMTNAPTAIATESVSDYLLADMGIKNITPPAYVAQSETEAGVSAKVLQDTKNAFTGKPTPILVLNAQTEDATAKQLIESAKSAKATTVEVAETLPTGDSNYPAFINKTINSFNTAVNGAGAKPLAECN